MPKLGSTNTTSFALHQLFGRLEQVPNKPAYVRNEAGQASEPDNTLSNLKGSPVARWSVASFSIPDTCYHDDPRNDRDMPGMSLVNRLPDGIKSKHWPGERYHAKTAFDVLADHDANS